MKIWYPLKGLLIAFSLIAGLCATAQIAAPVQTCTTANEWRFSKRPYNGRRHLVLAPSAQTLKYHLEKCTGKFWSSKFVHADLIPLMAKVEKTVPLKSGFENFFGTSFAVAQREISNPKNASAVIYVESAIFFEFANAPLNAHNLYAQDFIKTMKEQK